MTKGTFWIEEKPGRKTSIGITDYDVEFMDGADYEWIYTLDAENLKLLAAKLEQTHSGTLRDMIEAEFGIHLDKKSLRLWLDENGIEYEFFSWVS